MNWIDIVIIAVIAISVGMGVWRGFIHETLSLLAWVAAFVISRLFSPDVANWLGQTIESQALTLLLSWIIPFLSTLLAFNLLKLLLISLITMAGLRPIDRLLGAVFGALKGALLVTAAVIVMQLVLSRSGDAFKTDSKLVPHFQVIALWMLETLDKQNDLSFDNVVERLSTAFGTEIKSGKDALDLNYLKDKYGFTSSQISELLENNQTMADFKSIINNPEAIEKFKTLLNSKRCEQGNCSK